MFLPHSISWKVGYDMTQMASDKAYRKAGLRPSDVQVVELHDCFSANELISYEALGLCQKGKPPPPLSLSLFIFTVLLKATRVRKV